MNIKVFSHAYINNTCNINIDDTTSAILCRKVLEKYENELLDNLDGCIFKLSYKEPVTEWVFTDYVSCIEFTAPDNTAYISYNIYQNLCSMELDYLENVDIELYNPPQATKLTFRLSNELLDLIPDLKSSLEELLTKKYKFVKIGQYINFLNDKIMISELEPDNICLINNTDLEVDFEIVTKINKAIDFKQEFTQLDNEIIEDQANIVKKEEEINMTINELKPIETNRVPVLSREELRQKRLEALTK